MGKPHRTVQTFHVVPPEGAAQAVVVALGDDGWGEESFEPGYGLRHDSAREAAAGYAVSMGWPIAEIVAPGEPTRAELIARLERAERDALTTSVLDCYALATGNPDADPADALKASGAVLESISRLHASRDDLIDELGAVADALDVAPGAKVADTAIAVVGERDRYRRTLARLRPMVAEFERGVDDLAAERNRWRDTAEKQARLLAREVTPQDAVEFFTAAVLDEAAGAPNHAEWRGSYRGRQWTVTVQWADGQTPAQLIDAAVVEKDALAHAVRRERTAKANCRKANDALEAHAERYPFGQRTPWSEDRRRALAEACSAAGREQDAAIRALKALLGEEVSDG